MANLIFFKIFVVAIKWNSSSIAIKILLSGFTVLAPDRKQRSAFMAMEKMQQCSALWQNTLVINILSIR